MGIWNRRVAALTAAACVVALLSWTAPPGRAGVPSHAPHRQPTAGAVSVLDPAYGLTGNADDDPDDTAAFTAAITDALAGTVRYRHGPTGARQAVVYVPPGSYRLSGLVLPSNVRLEVNAGAVLEPALAPTDRALTAQDPIQLVALGSNDPTPVTNVSIVGVGTDPVDGPLKQRAQPTYDAWDISGSFTVDLDAADTGAPNDYAFATLVNVVGFTIANLYVVQNDALPSCSATTPDCPVGRGFYPSPTTGRAAIVYKPSTASGITAAGPFYDPTDGSLSNLYSVGAPYGFGPTQITSGHDLEFTDLYSQGGTTLRLETDDAAVKRYLGELTRVTATHIVGESCNRVVALSAHRQVNSDVHIGDVTAVGCQAGLVQAATNAVGTFTDTTVDGISIDGAPGAQVPVSNGGLWSVTGSVQPVQNKVPKRAWSVAVSGLTCAGVFSRRKFDSLLLQGVVMSPVCATAQ